MREETAGQRNTKFHHKGTKDTKVWTLRCNSDFKLVSLCIRRLTGFRCHQSRDHH